MDVLDLLDKKNKCLRKFLEVTESFMEQATKGDFTALEELQRRRETILKVVDLYDRSVSEAIEQLDSTLKTQEFTDRVRRRMDEKDLLVSRIIAADSSTIALLEAERERLKLEIHSNEKGRETVRKFKSRWVPEPGDGMDTVL